MVPTSALPRSPGHPFYAALNKLLAEAKFDAYRRVAVRSERSDSSRFQSIGLPKVGAST